MADLIERLRKFCDDADYYDPDNIEYRKPLRQAADEIAELRALLVEARDMLNSNMELHARELLGRIDAKLKA